MEYSSVVVNELGEVVAWCKDLTQEEIEKSAFFKHRMQNHLHSYLIELFKNKQMILFKKSHPKGWHERKVTILSRKIKHLFYKCRVTTYIIRNMK